MGGTVIATYASLYYRQIGLADDQIGIIMAAGAAVMLVSQPFWGTISDQARSKNFVLLIAIVVSSLLIWLYPLFGANFPAVLLITIALQFFSHAISPLSDTITLELAKQEGFKFSTVRLIGSLGFALMAAISGQILVAGIFLLFPLFSGLRLLSIGALVMIPKVPGHGHNQTENPGFFYLFRDRKLSVIYLYAFLLSITWAFFNSFYPVYATQVGIDTGLIGLGVTVGSSSQFPFMLLFDRLYRRFGIVNIMIVSGLFYALRWFLFAIGLSPVTVLPLMLMHGLNYIVLYLCLTEYVATHVAPALKTRGQMMNSLVLFGFSAIIGNLAGGFLSKQLGLSTVFLGSAMLCLLAVLLFAACTKLLWRNTFAKVQQT